MKATIKHLKYSLITTLIMVSGLGLGLATKEISTSNIFHYLLFGLFLFIVITDHRRTLIYPETLPSAEAKPKPLLDMGKIPLFGRPRPQAASTTARPRVSASGITSLFSLLKVPRIRIRGGKEKKPAEGKALESKPTHPETTGGEEPDVQLDELMKEEPTGDFTDKTKKEDKRLDKSESVFPEDTKKDEVDEDIDKAPSESRGGGGGGGSSAASGGTGGAPQFVETRKDLQYHKDGSYQSSPVLEDKIGETSSEGKPSKRWFEKIRKTPPKFVEVKKPSKIPKSIDSPESLTDVEEKKSKFDVDAGEKKFTEIEKQPTESKDVEIPTFTPIGKPKPTDVKEHVDFDENLSDTLQKKSLEIEQRIKDLKNVESEKIDLTKKISKPHTPDKEEPFEEEMEEPYKEIKKKPADVQTEKSYFEKIQDELNLLRNEIKNIREEIKNIVMPKRTQEERILKEETRIPLHVDTPKKLIEDKIVVEPISNQWEKEKDEKRKHDLLRAQVVLEEIEKKVERLENIYIK
ncbi:MAG: hypothetical protein JSW62_04360 [Thermoplasmatales archaeon]|nr:MAG: hypothetical protein JSW62_04360 [Thermoplasmatales archaeon]